MLSPIVQELLQALREHQLAVRQANWITPPWDSVPIAWSFSIDQAGAGANAALTTVRPVPFRAHPEAIFKDSPLVDADFESTAAASDDDLRFPQGWNGVVWVECGAWQKGTDITADVARQARFSVRKNGGYVEGHNRQMPGSTTRQLAAAAVVKNDLDWPIFKSPCPILLTGGDKLQVEVHTDELVATVTVGFKLRVIGWRFPEAFPGPDLRSFLVD